MARKRSKTCSSRKTASKRRNNRSKKRAKNQASTPLPTRQIAERDSLITELEGRIAEASKSAEAAEGLREEIAALKAQGESGHIVFQLQLAGCRNVKAARAILEERAYP